MCPVAAGRRVRLHEEVEHLSLGLRGQSLNSLGPLLQWLLLGNLWPVLIIGTALWSAVTLGSPHWWSSHPLYDFYLSLFIHSPTDGDLGYSSVGVLRVKML